VPKAVCEVEGESYARRDKTTVKTNMMFLPLPIHLLHIFLHSLSLLLVRLDICFEEVVVHSPDIRTVVLKERDVALPIIGVSIIAKRTIENLDRIFMCSSWDLALSSALRQSSSF
jgi:hypothetical protein